MTVEEPASKQPEKKPRLPLLTPRQAEFMRRAVDIEDLDPLQRGLGFQARLWAQVSLPYRDPGNVTSWSRRNGSVTLVIDPAIMSSRRGEPIKRGFPYGVTPRLLMSWIATEAIRLKECQLEVGTSMSRFMRELGMGEATGGKYGNVTRLREQVQRLAGCRITVLDDRDYGDTRNTKMESMQIASKWDLWLPKKEDRLQEALFPSTITLSEDFYSSILASPIPLKMEHLVALRSFRGSGMAIDIYTWLSWRMFNLKKTSRLITWERLAQQFGADYSRTRDFKQQFLRQLRPVTIVYPKARILVQDDGIVLRPSPTPVESA